MSTLKVDVIQTVAAGQKATLRAGTPLVKNPCVASSSTVQAHGLGVVPALCTARLECLTAEHNYSVGDVIDTTASALDDGSSAAGNGLYVVLTSTNVSLLIGAALNIGMNKTTFGAATLTPANWKCTVTPYALN